MPVLNGDHSPQLFRMTAVRRHPSQGGAVAQLGERLVRNEEVRGSNPLGSTKSSLLAVERLRMQAVPFRRNG